MTYKIFTLAFASLLLCIINTSAQTTGSVTDIDGNIYQTVVIGNQEWMTENLKVSHYSNGDPLLTDQTHTQWQSSTQGIWAFYDNDPANKEIYGKLYNFYATVDERGLCPSGWHVPSDSDWQELIEYIDPSTWGNNNNAGTKLKSCRQVNSPLGGVCQTTIHPRWDAHGNRYGTNEYGFNALPSGAYTPGAAFVHKGSRAYYWTTTDAVQNQAWARIFIFSNKGVSRGQYHNFVGHSVRCIRGNQQTVQVPQINTLIPSDITSTSATCGGDVIADGGAPVTTRGVVWSLSQNPTIDGNIGIINSGGGLGSYTVQITNLEPDKTYWVRAFATNEAGIAYGTQKRVTTYANVTLPQVSTSAITNITHNSAISGGNVASGGGAPVTARGVVWSTSQNPSLEENEGHTPSGQGTGRFYSILEDLTPNTTYHVKAYATNSQGTAYGNQVVFETETAETQLFSLSISLEPLNSGSTTGAGEYLAGTVVTLTATPASGYKFVSWSEGVAEALEATTTFTMPSEDVTLTANFVEEGGAVSWTPCPGMPTVTDIDGNIYNTVQIGGQCWIRENLKVTKYRNGDDIPTGPSYAEWMNIRTTGAYAIYPHYHEDIEGLNSDAEVLEAYGALYNWYAVDDWRGLCPSGWRVPTDQEWTELGDYVEAQGYPNGAGNTLKSCRQVDSPLGGDCSTNEHPRWNLGNTPHGNDAFGFSALPGGHRWYVGYFYEVGHSGSWWSSTHNSASYSWYRKINKGSSRLSREFDGHKRSAYSVRCLRDAEPQPTTYTLTLPVSPAEAGTTTGAGEYEAGTVVTLTATPASDYKFVKWTVGATEPVEVSTEATTTFIMPAEDVTLTANFEEVMPTTYTLTLAVSPENSGTTTGAGEYEAGTVVTLTATPASGYKFVSWTEGVAGALEATTTFTMPASNVPLTANFEKESGEITWTPCPGMPTVTDIDGNVYNTVQIGGQCWIRENLKVTKYNDNNLIPTGYTDSQWGNLTTGAYAIFPHSQIDGLNSDAEVLDAYGALYNWYAVNTGNLCLTGWHVPTDAEWPQLVDYVVAQGYPNELHNPNGAGNALKSCRQVDSPLGGDCATNEHPRWSLDNTHHGSDAFGFSALPGGSRYNLPGNFLNVGNYGSWWSRTELDATLAWYRSLHYATGSVTRSYYNKRNGFSVRCVRDN
jgi:uncharacterized protein (TIGR02145 family)